MYIYINININIYIYIYILTLVIKLMIKFGNWSEEVFVIKKIKNTEPGHIFSVILMGEKLLECITKINCKKQIEKTLELKK